MKNLIMAFGVIMGGLIWSKGVKTGTYSNTNPQTENIKKVRISESRSGQHYIRLYVACGTGECYWGRFEIEEYTGYDYLERQRRLPDGATWFGSYKSFTIDQGFVKRKVYLAKNLRHSDHIRITIDSDFKDSKRKDYSSRNILKLRR